MPRIRRSDLPAGFFHITARSVDETMLFRDDRDRLLFVLLFGRAIRRFGLRLHAYCLMGTHYHAILEATPEALSAAFHWLNSHYARETNARRGRRGHLFAQRFSSWVIDSEEHLEAAVAYVLGNPVAAGLAEQPEDWPWSGAAGTATFTERAGEGAALGGSLSRPPAGSTRTRARHEKKMPGESERQTIRASFRPNRTLVRVHPRG